MEAEMKVLVWRDRDAKKTESRCKNRNNRNIAVIIAAVLLLTALVGGIAASASTDKQAEDLETAAQAEVEMTETAEAVTETAETAEITDFAAETNAEVTAIVTPVLVAHEEYLGETEGTFDFEADYRIALMSDGDEEDYLPASKDLTGEKAGFEEKDQVSDGENVLDTAEGSDTEESETEEDVPTRFDEIDKMVSILNAPEDMPSKLTYKYNTAMQLNLSSEEITILERIVEAEATGEDVYGRMLVANVVINRVNDKYFPNTVKSVVFERSGDSVQFSPIKDGRYYTVPITEATKEAVRRVLAGEDYSRGALYFFERARTTGAKASWFDNNLKYLMKYGCHEFYTEYSK